MQATSPFSITLLGKPFFDTEASCWVYSFKIVIGELTELHWPVFVQEEDDQTESVRLSKARTLLAKSLATVADIAAKQTS